jgi:uncharacterized repeat protein (TIGR01451 family)
MMPVTTRVIIMLAAALVYLNVLAVSTNAAVAPTADSTPPTANATAPDIAVPGATFYQFTVEYTDDTAIDVATLGDDDVRVTGPNSYDTLAEFVSVDENADGSPRVATYRLEPPGDAWRAVDNGTYALNLTANGVADTAANGVAGSVIGEFAVRVAQPDVVIGVSGPTSITPEQTAEINITAVNQGGEIAYPVIDINLPGGFPTTQWSAGTPSEGWTTARDDGLTWWLTALQPGQRVELIIELSPTADESPVDVTVQASVPRDSDPSDNTGALSIVVAASDPDPEIPTPTLTLALTPVSPGPGETNPVEVVVGEPVTMRLDLANTGDAAATNVVVLLTLPEEVAFDSAQRADPPTAQSGPLTTDTVAEGVEMHLERLAAAAAVALVVEVRPLAEGSFTFSARARSQESPDAAMSAALGIVTRPADPPAALPVCGVPTLLMLGLTFWMITRRGRG